MTTAHDELPARAVAERFFEPQLQRLDLSVDQINTQGLDELLASLEHVNEAIEKAAGYETLAMRVTEEADVVIAPTASDAHFKCTIAPLLLERKKLILSRIRELGGRDAIRHAAREEDRFEHEAVQRQHKVAVARARADITLSLLAREPVASIVGGVLLLALGAAMIAAMFMAIEVSEPVATAFWLILGYFFAQSVLRDQNDSDKKPNDTCAS
jgi:hypothetical protein